MNRVREISMYLVLLIFVPKAVMAQDCVDYHRLGDCMMDRQRGYEIYSQSKSVGMSPTDTLKFNLVFYGQKEYIFSFCTHAKLYPIHFVLIDQDSGDVLYDNVNDGYIESLGMGFVVTKSLTIQVDVVARKASEEEITDYLGCLGLLIQYRNYPRKRINLQVQ
jgi:hypothetical protein